MDFGVSNSFQEINYTKCWLTMERQLKASLSHLGGWVISLLLDLAYCWISQKQQQQQQQVVLSHPKNIWDSPHTHSLCPSRAVVFSFPLSLLRFGEIQQI